MRVLSGSPADWPESGEPAALAVGVFDGLHAGHRAVLGSLIATSEEMGVVPGVVTFDPHPLAVVAPRQAPLMLTDIDQRLELLGAAGVRLAAVIGFDEHTRGLPPAEFVSLILVEKLGAHLVVVGEDFRFGRDRTGHVGLLRELGASAGFEARVLPLVGGEHPISSTAIREMIAGGDVESAGRALGRSHEVRGTVVAGDGRGRSIGIPTANLEVPAHIAAPGRGVYAVVVGRDRSEALPAVANIGVRPTFDGKRVVLEAHLLDFDDDLYGAELRVRFISRLRDEKKFDGPEALVAQIRDDISAARTALG